MKGKWKGFYKYDKKTIQEMVGVDKTFFSINIETVDGKNFKGTVEDDLETKGTPGIGVIEGEIVNERIKFVKKMPIHAGINASGELVTYKGKHPPIYYEGSLSNDKKTFKGTWKMKFGFSLIGFFILLLSTKGSWEMEKDVKQ